MRAVPSQRKHHSAPTPNLYAKKYQKFDSQSNIITAHIDFAIDWTITSNLQIYPVKKYKAPNFYWADMWAIF